MYSPLITIITPVYNAEVHLAKMLDSMLAQSYTDWELILVNDGSKDKSQEIIDAYCLKDTRIRSLYQDNSGPAAARNLGLSVVTGKYVTFVDADDVIVSTYLGCLLAPMLIDEAGELDLVCAGYFECNDRVPEGIPLHDFSAFDPQKHITATDFQANILKGLTGVLWAKLFRTEIIKTHNLVMPRELKLSEDLVFVLEYSLYVNKVALVYEPIYYYNRIGSEGLSGVFDKTYIKDFLLLNEKIKEIPVNIAGFGQEVNEKTGRQLLKMLKDQSHSVSSLKAHHKLVMQSFSSNILQFRKRKEDQLFVFFLRNNMYRLANLWSLFGNRLRELKHSK